MNSYIPSTSETGATNSNPNPFGSSFNPHHQPHHGIHHPHHHNLHHQNPHSLVYPNVVQLPSDRTQNHHYQQQQQQQQQQQHSFNSFVPHQGMNHQGTFFGTMMGNQSSFNPNSLPRTLASLSLPTAKGQDILRNPAINANGMAAPSAIDAQYKRIQGQSNAHYGTVAATSNNVKKIYSSKDSLNSGKAKARLPQNLPSIGHQYHTIHAGASNVNTAAASTFKDSLKLSSNNQSSNNQNTAVFMTTDDNLAKSYGTSTLRQQQGQLRKSKYATMDKRTSSGGKSHKFNTITAAQAAASTSTNNRSADSSEKKKHSESFQLTPEDALRKNWDKLTPFERVEIANYQTIYFVGGSDCRKIDNMESPQNHGYDDERGDYKITMKDHIAYRFEVIEMLGKGSFGQVVRAYDHKHGQMVAVKIIRNKKRFHQQALIEVKVLQHLRENDPDDAFNVIHIRNYFYFREHLCISFELLSMNLYEFIKLNNFHGCSLGLIRRFATQILQAMCLLKKSKIIHCDLKPENVLLKQPTKSAIKVIDFGSSCYEDQKIYTYIQSRFYRSPEVIMGISYSGAIDMWSLGCIMAELFTGHPIFPGENEQEQLLCIMEVLGVPSDKLLSRATRRDVFFDAKNAPKLAQDGRGRKRRAGSKALEQAIQCTDEKFLSFLEKCFIWEPEMRLDPFEALQHPFILDSPKYSSAGGMTEKENASNPTGKPLPPISYSKGNNSSGSFSKITNIFSKK